MCHKHVNAERQAINICFLCFLIIYSQPQTKKINMELTLFEEKQIRIESSRIAVEMTLAKFGIIKDEMSEREACRMPGVTIGVLKSLVNEGLLNRVKVGDRNSKCTYSRIELETVLNLKEKRKIK